MADLTGFPCTHEALDRLTDDLKCSKCGQLSDSLFSMMGVCEHMLCSDCSESNLGEDCPVCGLPTHVKDAQHNRQLSNMVKLCQELRGLLSTGGITPDEAEYISNCNGNLLSVCDFTGTPTSKQSPDVRNQRKVKGHTNYCELDSRENETEVRTVKRAQPKAKHIKGTEKKCRTSDGLRQTTMTQLFDDVGSDSEENVTPQKKERSRRGSGVVRTPNQSKNPGPHQVTPKSSKGHNSCSKGTQLCQTPASSTSSAFLPSPGTPLNSKKKLTDPLMKRNAKGETLLHVAVIKGDVERVRSLLEEGANPNTRDHAGWTPLHEACNHGFTEIAELLLNNGALINTPGLENDSPLHDAVSNNRVGCVKLLVSRGASQTARNIHGHTARDLAMSEFVREALDSEVVNQDRAGSSPVKHSSQVSKSQAASNPNEPVVLLGTSLRRDQKILLHKVASCLHARVVEEFSPEVTHIIAPCNKDGQCPRTIKYLLAILTGKWVLNIDWVLTCVEYGQHLPEEVFEVTGCTPNPDTQGPSRGRLNHATQLPRLFDGCKFYFSGTFEYPTPDVTELIQLVRCGGGTVLSREPKLHSLNVDSLTVPYHASSDSQLSNCGIYVVYDNKATFQPIRTEHLCTVTVSWLMDSIASFQLLDPPEIKT